MIVYQAGWYCALLMRPNLEPTWHGEVNMGMGSTWRCDKDTPYFPTMLCGAFAATPATPATSPVT